MSLPPLTLHSIVVAVLHLRMPEAICIAGANEDGVPATTVNGIARIYWDALELEYVVQIFRRSARNKMEFLPDLWTVDIAEAIQKVIDIVSASKGVAA